MASSHTSAGCLSPNPPRRLRRLARLAVVLAGCTPALAHAADLHSAERLLLDGNAAQATAQLKSVLAADRGNGNAHLLLCRVYLSLDDGKAAGDECQAALSSGLGSNSAAQDWAGRAFGMQAEHAGPFTGMRLAGKVRDAFEAAHRLDPRNDDATLDLGLYYINAPSIVGGGPDKASALASSLESSQPGLAHHLRGVLAEKAKDPATAEREFLAETTSTPGPSAFVSLAAFYQRQKQTAKSVAAARKALSLDREVGPDSVDAASVLAAGGQTAEAIRVLHAYLDHGRRSDSAPAFRVLTTLAGLQARTGDRDGARASLNQALVLAPSYAPAKKALGAL